MFKKIIIAALAFASDANSLKQFTPPPDKFCLAYAEEGC